MPIDVRKSRSWIIRELLASWEETGKIGNNSPKTEEEAIRMAIAIAIGLEKENM